MKKPLIFAIPFCLFLLSCGGGGDDAPPPLPQSAVLEFPFQNSECTTGVSLNETTSQVEFRWRAATNTDLYELRAINLNTNITQTISVQTLFAQLPLEKGAPYSWIVVSRNSEANGTATSETWQFYNAGSQTTYAPFRAQATTPTSGTTVFKDINNEVLLSWSSADVDNDIEGYELYFSEVTPPTTLVASPAAATTEFKVSVTSDTAYYWRVVTRDAEGNTSDSGVFEFKVQ
ncbi:hypothetical protein [Spongiimicrobium sp. 3-5]|uniref:hypothetical protein n=1 Tax=Spongiimicrobium sp. 3-5 TaxID=3332596 RepID=UPI003980715F